MTLTANQLLMRRDKLGASEIAAVAGLNPYSTPFDVWLSKTAQNDIEENDAMLMGNLLEEPIAQFYKRKNPDVELTMSDTLVHPEHEWAMATPDRNVLRDGKRIRLLEIKNAGINTAREWSKEDDGIPEQYIAQTQWQLYVAGESVADVAALVAGTPKFYRIERNEALIKFLFERGQEFMKLLRSGGMPKLEGDGAKRWLLDRFPVEKSGMREATASEVELIRAYQAARDAESAAKESKERLGNELRAAIGDAEGIFAGSLKATNKAPDGVTMSWAQAYRELAVRTNASAEILASVERAYSKPAERKIYVTQTKKGKAAA